MAIQPTVGFNWLLLVPNSHTHNHVPNRIHACNTRVIENQPVSRFKQPISSSFAHFTTFRSQFHQFYLISPVFYASIFKFLVFPPNNFNDSRSHARGGGVLRKGGLLPRDGYECVTSPLFELRAPQIVASTIRIGELDSLVRWRVVRRRVLPRHESCTWLSLTGSLAYGTQPPNDTLEGVFSHRNQLNVIASRPFG